MRCSCPPPARTQTPCLDTAPSPITQAGKDVLGLRRFSAFLTDTGTNCRTPARLDRELIERYLAWLALTRGRERPWRRDRLTGRAAACRPAAPLVRRPSSVGHDLRRELPPPSRSAVAGSVRLCDERTNCCVRPQCTTAAPVLCLRCTTACSETASGMRKPMFTPPEIGGNGDSAYWDIEHSLACCGDCSVHRERRFRIRRRAAARASPMKPSASIRRPPEASNADRQVRHASSLATSLQSVLVQLTARS